MFSKLFSKGYKSLFQVVELNADILVFKILLLHNNINVFCSFPIVGEHQSVSVFERGDISQFSCIRRPWKNSIDLKNTWKSPGILP